MTLGDGAMVKPLVFVCPACGAHYRYFRNSCICGTSRKLQAEFDVEQPKASHEQITGR